ncbi:MAG: hypothetical protein R2932_02870 [Caldilineaceae bacterium]
MFLEKAGCGGNFRFGLLRPLKISLDQGFGLIDAGGDLAVVEVGRKGHKAHVGQPPAEGTDRFVEPPPRVEDEDSSAGAAGGQSQIAFWLCGHEFLLVLCPHRLCSRRVTTAYVAMYLSAQAIVAQRNRVCADRLVWTVEMPKSAVSYRTNVLLSNGIALTQQFQIWIWTLANSYIIGVMIGRPSSVVTRLLTEKRHSPVEMREVSIP